MNRLFRSADAGYLQMIAPSVVLLVAITIVPIFATIYISMNFVSLTNPAASGFIGFENYRYLLEDSRYLNSLRVMLILIAFPVTFQIILGMILAIALKEKLPGTGWMRVFFLLPAVIPPAVSGLVWKLFIVPGAGGVTYLGSMFGADLGARPPERSDKRTDGDRGMFNLGWHTLCRVVVPVVTRSNFKGPLRSGAHGRGWLAQVALVDLGSHHAPGHYDGCSLPNSGSIGNLPDYFHSDWGRSCRVDRTGEFLRVCERLPVPQDRLRGFDHRVVLSYPDGLLHTVSHANSEGSTMSLSPQKRRCVTP